MINDTRISSSSKLVCGLNQPDLLYTNTPNYQTCEKGKRRKEGKKEGRKEGRNQGINGDLISG